jgi:hypothetical protein
MGRGSRIVQQAPEIAWLIRFLSIRGVRESEADDVGEQFAAHG